MLKDKVAIITGAARGMGREFTLRFVKEGAKVTICDIHDCEPVAKEIKALMGEALVLRADIASEDDVAEMAKKTAERFGRIDILVNNAAIFGGIENKDFVKPFEQISIPEWDTMMAVNVKGIFLCCKAVLPYMKKQGGGRIINIASTVAFSGIPDFMHYTTSKGAVVTMTRALARALGDFNINVNAVAPGLTWTASTQAIFTEEMAKQSVVATQCLKRFTTAAHVAGAVVFLASDDAEQITGQTLVVNGGDYLH